MANAGKNTNGRPHKLQLPGPDAPPDCAVCWESIFHHARALPPPGWQARGVWASDSGAYIMWCGRAIEPRPDPGLNTRPPPRGWKWCGLWRPPLAQPLAPNPRPLRRWAQKKGRLAKRPLLCLSALAVMLPLGWRWSFRRVASSRKMTPPRSEARDRPLAAHCPPS
jgi:hypothetical protein